MARAYFAGRHARIPCPEMPDAPGLLARGPWRPEAVSVSWSEEEFELAPEASAQADQKIADLQERGSPSHDGIAARLAGFTEHADGLALELQPTRWSLRLTDDADGSLAALCVTRDAAGRWLAGRRAPWLASWAGRWALGAGGAVEVGENPVHTLSRELEEEWSVVPERLRVEALVRLPTGVAMLVGQAWLPDGAEVTRDPEHDAHAWWPPDPAEWPDEADQPLRRMATLLDAAG
jgi:8-oxo-dGTP diphosphatase